MKNNFITKIIGATLAFAMMIGGAVGINAAKEAKEAYAATNSTTYSLINDTADLEAGKSYIITSGTTGSVKAIAVTENTNNRKTTSVTVGADGKITRGASIMSFTLGGTSGAWTFATENYAGTDGYLSSDTNKTSTKNYLLIDSTARNSTISFEGDEAVINIAPHNSRTLVRFNSGSDLFACYGSGQSAVYLWKEAAAASTPSIVFTEETINGEEGDEFSFTYETANLTEAISWTPANNNTDIIDYTVNEGTKTVSGTLSNAGTVTLTATAGTASDSVVFNVAEHFTNRKYTVSSKTEVAETGDEITDASASFNNSYTGQNDDQMTGGNEMTLSITGMSKRVNINKIVLSMHSNASAGAGYVSISIDGVNHYLSGDTDGVGFNEFGDNEEFGSSYRAVTWDNLSYSANSSIVIKIHATVNSLYCQWFDIFFTEEEITDTVTALSASPNSWEGYDTQTINVSDYTVSVTKNGEPGTASDYDFQGIGSGEGDGFVARVANFTSGHPALTDTRLQWKAKYPSTVGGSSYLYAYVSLDVTEDTIASIALSGDMSKTDYYQTDSWDKSGLVVTGTYLSGNTVDVTNSSTFNFYCDSAMTQELVSPASLNIAADQTIYVKATYSGIQTAVAYEQTISINRISTITFTSGTDTGSSSSESPDTLTKAGISIAFSSAYTASGTYRIYKNSETTISSTIRPIVKIEFNMNGSYKSNLLSVADENGDYDSSTNSKGVWTGVASSITFAASAQARVNSIVITLAASDKVNPLNTRATLSYSGYTKADENNYTFTDVAIRFGGLISTALWDELDTEAHLIKGYGVMISYEDLAGDTFEYYYNESKAGKTVEQASDYLFDNDGVGGDEDEGLIFGKDYYFPLSNEKTHPAVATASQKAGQPDGEYYIWNLYKNVSMANLAKEYTAVAYIRLGDELVFLQQTTDSASSLAFDLIDSGAYAANAFGGSLAYLASL